VTASAALLVSIALVLFLLRVRVPSGPAVFCGSLALAMLVLGPNGTPRLMLAALVDVQTLRLFGIVVCALTMSRLMELRGMLVRLANALEGIGPRLAIHVAPIAIGLMPLPGGALVSATAVKDLVRRMRLTPEQATFINFWYRHICEFATPVYPGVIMAGVFLSVGLGTLLLHLAPIWLLMIAFGSVVSIRILRGAPVPEPGGGARGSIPREIVRSAWPVLLVVALVVAGLDAAPAFLATLVALPLVLRLSRGEVVAGLKCGFEPRILFLLYAVMLYKTVVEASGAAQAMFDDMQALGMPPLIILTGLPLLIGFATGLSSAMVGISIPLLTPFLLHGSSLDGPSFLLAYGAGGLGYMLSPLHLCLVLSAEYFKARLAAVYRYLLPPAVAILLVLGLVYILSA
jgi:integral membrane protein (TIGR00529 family)